MATGKDFMNDLDLRFEFIMRRARKETFASVRSDNSIPLLSHMYGPCDFELVTRPEISQFGP